MGETIFAVGTKKPDFSKNRTPLNKILATPLRMTMIMMTVMIDDDDDDDDD
jgi:hypothetical protein